MAGDKALRLGVLALVLSAWSAPAPAQAPVSARPLSLGDAMRLSLEKAPLIRLAGQDIARQKGSLRQAEGAFDSAALIAPLFQHSEKAIELTPYFDQERVKRGFAEALARSFTLVADVLAEQRRLGRGDLPLCPTDGTYSSYVVTLPGSALPVPLCRPASLSLGTQSYDNIAAGGDYNLYQYRRAMPVDPMTNYQLQAMLATAFQVQVATALLDVRERSYEMLDTLQSMSRDVAVQAALIYDRLGGLPKYAYSNAVSVVGEYSKPFRNGSVFQARMRLDGSGLQYRGKPIDPNFGGSSVPNTYGDRFEVIWTQPLMRGRGAETVRAPERAAAKNVEASQFNFQQTSADQLLSVADAYFTLVAAEESLALTRQSLENQRRMLENTIKLVAAGDVASAEVTRARASTTFVESEVQAASLAVVSAQAGLADVLGLPAGEIAAFRASDRFPATPPALDLDGLSKDATARRADVKALSSFRDTSRILLGAARANMRPRFDLTFNIGVTQNYYGPMFSSLPDETGRSADSYVAYYNPLGIGRGFRERLEPVAAVTGTFELPFGNNRRAGRFAQASASSRESEIRLTDLQRAINNRVPRYAEDVRRTRAEWQQRQEAVVAYEVTWDASQRLRAAGEMTLIDTLLTEQQLMQARLQLVQAKREYTSAVARFKRETGTLINFADWVNGQPDLAGLVGPQ
jgi:outer membrane protein TolC